jgi:hypothetical protein
MRHFYLTVTVSLFLLSSCGQIKKEVASDQIVGTYTGKATFIYKHSLQNVGLEDQTKESKGTVSIFKNSKGEIFLKTGDGNLKISGITLASNGTTFGIPYQKVAQTDGSVREFQGLQVASLDGIKYDGIYFSESNILNFGYETVIKHEYWGQIVDLSVQCVYEFSKLQ